MAYDHFVEFHVFVHSIIFMGNDFATDYIGSFVTFRVLNKNNCCLFLHLKFK